jgi:uncharacterized membrane protein
MQRFWHTLEHQGLALLALAAAVALFAWLFLRRKPGERSTGPAVLAGGLAIFGIGGLSVPEEAGMWTAAACGGLLIVAGLVVLISSSWSFYLGLLLDAGLFLGLGGLLAQSLSETVYSSVKTMFQGEFGSPWWLLVLLVIPAIIFLSFRSLAGLGPVRRWIAISLRCLLIVLLALALSEVRLRKSTDSLTVMFVVDRSLSIPQEINPDDPIKVDLRWKRIQSFIANAVLKRGTGHELDQSGVIVFGRRPRLALPPSTADKLVIANELAEGIDPAYTDIGGAIKLALASFPEGSSKRIVLISDGNENLGNAEEQARLAKLNGIQIDVVTVAAGYKNENEVLVQAVEAPPVTEQGTRLPIRVLIRSYNPRLVRGQLQVMQKSTDIVVKDGAEGEAQSTVIPVRIQPGPGVEKDDIPAIVVLRPGLNSFSFKPTLASGKGSYTYEAKFSPLHVMNDDGQWVAGLSGDRGENNTASTHVVALGQRRVLFVEADGKAGQHRLLMNQLPRSGKSKFQVFPITTNQLPPNKGDLGVFLSNFDCVVFANVPAELLTNDQMEMIRSNTYDQGCGFVMIGGPDSFGAGGWQDTPVERALPVDCDIKNIQVAGKGGLVLIFHASEMSEGNRWQKEVGKLAVRKLSPVDMMGVIYWNFGTDWHVKFQTVGGNKSSILSQIDKMTPNDMPDCNPSLQLAYQELTKAQHQLATKHCIFISDGDHWTADVTLLNRFKQAGISCTTVLVTNHPGQTYIEKMKEMAKATGGRSYHVTDPSKLPQIYIQEARIVSQSFISEGKFVPALRHADGPAAGLTAPLPPLHGFVRTSKKPSALSSMPVEGPSIGDQEFPILAYWHYGLGKAVAFTSDARSQRVGAQGWDREWAASDIYLKFWEQVVGWTLRSIETGKLAMTTETKDGKIKVTVDARDPVTKKPITNLRLEGAVTAPSPNANGGKPILLDFKQKNAGQYEAEFKADEAGSYFLNTTAKQTVEEMKDGQKVLTEKVVDGVRSGVTIPYSPEFADLETNLGALKRIAEITGGNVYDETDADLKRVVEANDVYRTAPTKERSYQPFWFWLVLLAGMGLFVDVAIRRVAVEPSEAWGSLKNWWNALRGRREDVVLTPFLERLKSRKSSVGDQLEKGRAAKRFEGESLAGAAPPPGADAATAAPQTRPKPAAPAEEITSDDFAARLLRAKKKAMDEHDEKKE